MQFLVSFPVRILHPLDRYCGTFRSYWGGVSVQERNGKLADLLHNGKPVVRYLHKVIDESSPKRSESTVLWSATRSPTWILRAIRSQRVLTKGRIPLQDQGSGCLLSSSWRDDSVPVRHTKARSNREVTRIW